MGMSHLQVSLGHVCLLYIDWATVNPLHLKVHDSFLYDLKFSKELVYLYNTSSRGQKLCITNVFNLKLISKAH